MGELSCAEKDYMEAIYILKRRRGYVRSIDVAHYLERSKPSVSRAVSALCDKGYLQKTDRELAFTESGLEIAEQIARRHCILTHALTEIGVDAHTAQKEARVMERVISEESVDRTAAQLQCVKQLSDCCPIAVEVGGPACE